jgi:oligoendopeptidase F
MKQIIWNLQHLFKNDDDPNMEKQLKDVVKKSYQFINKWKNRKDYLKYPDILRQALDDYERWKRTCGTDGKEGYYFLLRTAQDQNNPHLKAKYNKVENVSKKIENDIQFFYLSIAKISKRRQKKFLESSCLKPYIHFLERIFAESQYLLSEHEEKILNLKTSPAHSNWVKLTSSFLSKEVREVINEHGKKDTLTIAEILSLMNSHNKKVRDSASKAFNDIMYQFVDVAESEINAILQNKKIDDELRTVSRPDLTRHINDDIDSEIVDKLVKTVSNRFDISSQFYALKAKLLKVKKLKYHERNVELVDINEQYSFHKSIKLIHKVLLSLDSEFIEIFTRFIEHGQFDVYPRKGKTNGAFCAHHLISQPTYILLNHTNKLRDILTLAHELGHGINNELIKKKQHALNFGTPTSTAEVASTFMEDFVLQEILKKADDESKLSILMTKLNDEVSTIFRQIACYQFEQELHDAFRKKCYISKKDIGELFQKHMSAYMGDYVEQSPGSENWWVYWSHIRSFFYVYSYASGLLISKSLQNSVKENPGFINKVKEFLSAGLSDSPKVLFSQLGIDITDRSFWDKGLTEVETLLQETSTLATKLGKIH